MYITSNLSYKEDLTNDSQNLYNLMKELFPEDEEEKIHLNPHYLDKHYPRFRTRSIPQHIVARLEITKLRVRSRIHLRASFERIIDVIGIGTIDKSGYQTFNIPKATGGYRTIEAPTGQLKEKMRMVKYLLDQYEVNVHDNAYAYVKGRSCRDAVKRHLNNKSCFFLKIDLKDFFGSITPELLKDKLTKIYPFAFEETATDLIINLATKDNKLPQGTELSPLLSNLVMLDFDHLITAELLPQGFVYTRYADDILISHRNSFNYTEVVNIVETLLDPRLSIKKEKTRYGTKNGRNFNLGIMYNKDMELTVGHERKRKVKRLVHYLLQDNLTDKATVRKVLGELSYIKMIEPKYYNYILNYFNNKYQMDLKQTLQQALK